MHPVVGPRSRPAEQRIGQVGAERASRVDRAAGERADDDDLNSNRQPDEEAAQPARARLSTATAMIVNTSRKVPSASATMPWATLTPLASAVSPTPPRSVALSPTKATMSSAPPSAPASCATTYAGTSTQLNRRAAARESVTAGLMWAPDVVPRP